MYGICPAHKMYMVNIIRGCCVFNRTQPGLGRTGPNPAKFRYALTCGTAALLVGTSSQQIQERRLQLGLCCHQGTLAATIGHDLRGPSLLARQSSCSYCIDRPLS